MKHTLNQLEEDITARTNQSKSLHMETISLHHDRDNIEKENAFMSMKVDSLKKQTSRLTSELN